MKEGVGKAADTTSSYFQSMKQSVAEQQEKLKESVLFIIIFFTLTLIFFFLERTGRTLSAFLTIHVDRFVFIISVSKRNRVNPWTNLEYRNDGVLDETTMP